MVEFTTNQYGSSKGILAYPDHYVARAITIPANADIATTVGNRKVVKAGTIYPANDETAEGVIMNDVDVTLGDKTAALIIHGFIKTAALPEEPNETAIPVLKLIQFI